MQSSVLKKYPASLSITAYSHLFGSLLMVLTGLFTTDGLSEWILTWSEIVAVLYAVSFHSCFTYWILWQTCQVRLCGFDGRKEASMYIICLAGIDILSEFDRLLLKDIFECQYHLYSWFFFQKMVMGFFFFANWSTWPR